MRDIHTHCAVLHPFDKKFVSIKREHIDQFNQKLSFARRKTNETISYWSVLIHFQIHIQK